MRRWGCAIFIILGAGAAAADERLRGIGEVSLSQLQALSAREARYPLNDRWSVELGQDAGMPMEAYVPGAPIDDARTRTRLTLSLNLAPDARVQPYVGVGIGNEDYERFSPGKPYETGGNALMDFAATVVAGFDMDAGDGWSMKFKADAKKVGLGMRYTLN